MRILATRILAIITGFISVAGLWVIIVHFALDPIPENILMPLIIIVALCTLTFGYIIFLEIKKERAENALLEAQKDTLKNRCMELLPTLKTKRQYFRLWRSYDHMDFEREEAYDTNYIWDGLNGVVLVENDYAVSGPAVVDKAEPEVFVNSLRPRGLKHLAEALEGVAATA